VTKFIALIVMNLTTHKATVNQKFMFNEPTSVLYMPWLRGCMPQVRPHDTHHNDTEHNDTEHNNKKRNTQHNDSWHDDTRNCNAECHYAECHK
jgi:hypothetical protein